MGQVDKDGPVRAPTLKDVAERVGLSTTTVHRAVANPSLVRGETYARISEAIETLGYHPNLTARSLRYRQTRLLMVVAPSFSPFFLAFFQGAEKAATAAGYSVLVGYTDRAFERERLFIDQVLSQRADGLVLVTSANLPALARDLPRLPPMVAALDVSADAGLPTVRVDHAAAGEMATRRLLELGHRRIAHIAGPSGGAMAAQRLEGYRRALRDAGLEPDPALCAAGDFTVEGGERAVATLGDQFYTAIFAANDETAIGAIRALRRKGLSVPADVSVIGVDDQPMAALGEPPLTTVRVPAFDIGRRSTEILIRRLSGQSGGVVDEVLPCSLVERASCASPRAR